MKWMDTKGMYKLQIMDNFYGSNWNTAADNMIDAGGLPSNEKWASHL
jgi:hypothetical protein